tara:strand:- start:107 stop:478 length:372 start_codon:yes stop_codon:yes gene_type:complete
MSHIKIINPYAQEPLTYEFLSIMKFEVTQHRVHDGVLAHNNEFHTRIYMECIPYAIDSNGKKYLKNDGKIVVDVPSIEKALMDYTQEGKIDTVQEAEIHLIKYLELCRFIIETETDSLTEVDV